MDLDTEFDLAEVAVLLGVSVEKLIRLSANGKLTISVMAEEWTVRKEDKTAETITDLVNLLPEDLKMSYVADYTLIRKVATLDEGEVLTLDDPAKLPRGKLLIAPEEFDRFRRQHGLTLKHGAGSPPYLNPHHDCYAAELAIAVEVWMAIFGDGNFQICGNQAKTHIERWLSARNAKLPDKEKLSDNARGRIATLVNPIKAKKGGAPSTFAE